MLHALSEQVNGSVHLAIDDGSCRYVVDHHRHSSTGTPEALEGFTAFREKRKPDFGRFVR